MVAGTECLTLAAYGAVAGMALGPVTNRRTRRFLIAPGVAAAARLGSWAWSGTAGDDRSATVRSRGACRTGHPLIPLGQEPRRGRTRDPVACRRLSRRPKVTTRSLRRSVAEGADL